jgi:hypothetical protein
LAIKLQWSSCRGHLKQDSLVLNCLPEGGAYARAASTGCLGLFGSGLKMNFSGVTNSVAVLENISMIFRAQIFVDNE